LQLWHVLRLLQISPCLLTQSPQKTLLLLHLFLQAQTKSLSHLLLHHKQIYLDLYIYNILLINIFLDVKYVDILFKMYNNFNIQCILHFNFIYGTDVRVLRLGYYIGWSANISL